MTEKFIAEPEPSRKGGWLVVRVDTNGERFVTPGRSQPVFLLSGRVFMLK